MRNTLLNVVGLGGFGVLCTGCWMLNPAAACIIGGGLALTAAVFGITRKG